MSKSTSENIKLVDFFIFLVIELYFLLGGVVRTLKVVVVSYKVVALGFWYLNKNKKYANKGGHVCVKNNSYRGGRCLFIIFCNNLLCMLYCGWSSRLAGRIFFLQ